MLLHGDMKGVAEPSTELLRSHSHADASALPMHYEAVQDVLVFSAPHRTRSIRGEGTDAI